MEEWQRQYIKSIRCSLVMETICNEALLQQLLSDAAFADVDLEAIRCTLTPSEKAQTLYDIMETKKDGYVAMVKALADCNQIGAHQILLQGYAYCLSRNTRINFLGKIKQASEYFEDAEIREIIDEAKLKLLEIPLNRSWEYPEYSPDEIALMGKFLPPPSSLYLPRQLFKRVVINKSLFQAKSSDIFVFKGILALRQLDTLVHPQRSTLSSSSVAQQTLTARFILLEDDDHWKRILQMVNVPTHLVKFEEEANTCVLEITSGGSKVISQHLERPQESIEEETNHKFLSEDDFIDDIIDGGSETGNGICICDSPGMGKTFLLAKFAHEVSGRCPEKLVAFISLPHFIEHVTKKGVPYKIDSVWTRNAVLEYLSTSPLSACILDKILKKLQVPVVLLFDGFDEVNVEYIDLTKSLLKELGSNFSNIKFIVTSRPNLRADLEATLGVIAFDIAKFTEANQNEFLVNYWGNESEEFDRLRLAEFSRYCLKSLSSGLTKEEQSITAIPLLCRLFAEVYSRNAKRFARSNRNALTVAEDGSQFAISLPSLYAKYIEESFVKLNTKSELITQVKQYHIWKALQSLFPKFESAYRRAFSVNTNQLIMDSSISVGLLESRITGGRKTVEFVHRTFAEYLVSEFIAKTLKNLHEQPGCSKVFKNKFVTFLLETVLVTKDIQDSDDVDGMIFTHSVVVYFLNYFAEIEYTPQTFQILAQHFSASVPFNHLYSMLFGCLRGNYENLFKLIKNALSCVDTEAKGHYKAEMIPDGDTQLVVWLINTASVFSSITLVNALFAMFRDCFSYDLDDVCKEIPTYLDTPLHFAIERADVEKIQYFAKVMSLKGRKLLLSSVISSNDDSPQIIKRKAEMCRLLLSMDKELLSEAPYTLYDSVHVEILKVLIKEGADPRATKSEETVVHCGAKYMSNSDFHELCRFLIMDCKAEHLFKSSRFFWFNQCFDLIRQGRVPLTQVEKFREQIKNYVHPKKYNAICRQFVVNHSSVEVTKLNEPKWKSPLPYILRQQKSITAHTVEMIAIACGIDVHERDEDGNTLFLVAVKEGHDEKVLGVLMQNGADINAVNIKRQNALHLTTENVITHSIPFLINIGVDCRHRDSMGNSFLHDVAGLNAEDYHCIVSLLSSLGKTNVFHMKDQKGRLPIHLAVASLQVFTETLQIFKNHNVDFSSIGSNNNSLLIYGVLGGRKVSLLRTLIEMGVDVMVRNSNGFTFAHFISTEIYSEEEYHELVSFLISNGHENAFLAADNKGRTPLHCAVYFKELLPETLDLIHKKLVVCDKVNINTTDYTNRSLLMYAAEGKRSRTIVKALINWGADVMIQDEDGETMAHYISKYYSAEEYHDMIELLIESGHGELFQVKDKNGHTPLHVAVRHLVLFPKTLDLINMKLVQTGVVDINSTDNDGATILMSAVIYRAPLINTRRLAPIPTMVWTKEETSFLIHRSIGGFGNITVPKGNWSATLLQTLVEMGADVLIQDKPGESTFVHWIPYSYSANEYHQVLEFLVGTKNQRAFQIVNKKGQNPLHFAVYMLELLDETLNLADTALFQTGIVDINSCTSNGSSFLVCAVEGKRSVHFLENLMEMGVDVMMQNENGNTFAHAITANYTPNEYHQIVELLLQRGLSRVFQIKNSQGQNPLHCAVILLELLDETLNLFNAALFQTGIVDINSCTTDGNSLLVCAAKGERSARFLEILMKMGVNATIQNDDGNTFAHIIPAYCTPHHYHEIIVSLIETGQPKAIMMENIYAISPLHIAIYVLELLPETVDLFAAIFMSLNTEIPVRSPEAARPIGLNAVTVSGDSVLHYALRGKRSLDLVKYLVNLGANWSVKNKHGSNLAHKSASLGLVEHLKYFVQLGCSVNALDNDRDNVLQCAVADASENIYEMVTFLLEMGADKQHRNSKEQTAYAYAIEKNITDQRILDALK